MIIDHTPKVNLIMENAFKAIKSPHNSLHSNLQPYPFGHSIYTHNKIEGMKMGTIDQT
jgi:hypothetical protein